MPSSKLAFFRYLHIDQMLRNKQHKYPTKSDLLDSLQYKFGVRSASTVEKDLGAMRLEFDAPIKYHPTFRGYYYEDPSFKLLSVNLSAEHLTALRFVETFLEEFKALPIFSEFSDAVDKVLDGLEITRNFNKESVNVQSFIQIDKSQYVKGSEVLSELINVISEKEVIKINYQKFNTQEETEYTLHPYLLKEFKNLWYVIGYVEERKEIRTFGVDRINSIEKLEEVFLTANIVHFEPMQFFEHCYGVTSKNEAPQKIVLRFDSLTANYVKASPIHATQEVIFENENECHIALKVVNNFEIKSWILGFGVGVRVLEPEGLKQEICEILEQAVSNYKE